ncbi:hypothetical protein CDD83_1008 [Cordyceps sp. RAO-2017]|nr:hypothetical protein CDD83_1008 [Cordyceps sp. RAO-2017]
MAPETPRAVSSRLLTMKFMQRAAASASSAASSDSDSPAKKRRLERSPAQGRINAHIDQALIKAALDDQEAVRQAALEQHASAGSHWTLDNTWNKKAGEHPATTRPNILYVGYADIDSSNESGDNEEAPAKGRTTTKKSQSSESKGRQGDAGREAPSADDESESRSSDEGDDARRKRKSTHVSSGDEDEDDDDDDDDEDVPSSRDRSASRLLSLPKRSKESVKAKEFRDKRVKKEVRLNRVTSISSGGSNTFSSRAPGKQLTCYACGQAGHKSSSSDCPKRSTGVSSRLS